MHFTSQVTQVRCSGRQATRIVTGLQHNARGGGHGQSAVVFVTGASAVWLSFGFLFALAPVRLEAALKHSGCRYTACWLPHAATPEQVALPYSGVTVQWCYRTATLPYSGVTAQWCCRTAALPYSGVEPCGRST